MFIVGMGWGGSALGERITFALRVFFLVHLVACRVAGDAPRNAAETWRVGL